MRRILHVDLDAFFASVEELDHPEWKGTPLVVGADPQNGAGRGVVTTANYAARVFGIRSAMPISEAWRRCPTARFAPPRFHRYQEKSEEVLAVLHEVADMVEPASIDEAYLDITDRTADFDAAIALAADTKARITKATALTGSIGVASNKLVAKIASDMDKPDGLTIVRPGEEAAFLAPLPVRKIPGIGPKTEARLHELGVITCAELAALPPHVLAAEFGVWGPRLAQMALGEDETPVILGWERKSLGNERTFPQDVDDPLVWETAIRRLVTEAVAQMKEEHLMARTLTLKVRVTGFETTTRARTLPRATDDAPLLADVALALLQENPPARAVRLLGVRLTGLQRLGNLEQRPLSDWPADILGEAAPWKAPQKRLDDWRA